MDQLCAEFAPCSTVPTYVGDPRGCAKGYNFVARPGTVVASSRLE